MGEQVYRWNIKKQYDCIFLEIQRRGPVGTEGFKGELPYHEAITSASLRAITVIG